MSSIAPADLLALIDRGNAPPIVDVRSPAEFVGGHVPGAVNVPFTQVWSAAPQVQFMAGERVIVYCGLGPRAWIASLGLRRRGVRQIVYLRGHWTGWRVRACESSECGRSEPGLAPRPDAPSGV